jgi:hypothetical protein
MSHTLKKAIYKETASCLLVNLVIVTIITYLTLPEEELLVLIGGPQSGGFGIFPTSLIFTLLVTILLGTGMHKKMHSGEIELTGFKGNRSLGALPKKLFFRAIVFSLCATLVTAPIFLTAGYIVLGSEVSYVQAFVFNEMYVALLTLLVVPLIIYSSAFHQITD